MANTQMKPWYAEEYRARVTHLYQARGFMLRGMVTKHSRIEGKKAHWPTMGSGEAHKKVPNKAGKTMNAPTGTVSADLETWEALENVEPFDADRMKPEEKQAQQLTGVRALGRATDLEILGKAHASANKTDPAFFLDKSGTAFDLEMATEMESLLADQLEGQASETFMMVPPRMWANLLKFKQFTSSDYIGGDLPFMKKVEARTWNGINFIRGPKSYFEAYAPDADNYDVIMWDKAAIGWANDFDVKTWWTWDNKFGRWDLRLETQGAAVVIQPKGLITVRASKTGKTTFN